VIAAIANHHNARRSSLTSLAQQPVEKPAGDSEMAEHISRRNECWATNRIFRMYAVGPAGPRLLGLSDYDFETSNKRFATLGAH